MRRIDREVKDFNKIIDIINECEIIRIGLSDGDFPYIVPVNFSYEVVDNKLYFYIHGAMAGRKYEMIMKNPLCSFELDIPIKMDILTEKKDITMRYKSVMGKAKAYFISDEDKEEVMDNKILSRYESTKGFDYNKESLKRCAIIKLEVLEITAKANIGKDAD